MSYAPPFQRARKPDEVAVRRKAILDAAAVLFDRAGLAGVSLSAVARRAGIAKSNLYRYYESREAIFLALLGEDQVACVSALEQALTPVPTGDVAGVARAMARTLEAAPRFCALTAAAAGVLELNVSTERVIAHKRDVLRVGVRLGNALRATLPSLPASALAPLLRYVHAVVAGLYPIAFPAPSSERAMKQAPEIAVLRSELGPDLEALFGAILASLCRSAVA